MVSFYFAFFLMLILPQSLSAQRVGEAIMGFKAGANITDYKGDSEELATQGAYHAGFYLSVRFGKRFGFQPEILYSQQKASEILAPGSRATYGYFILPLTAKIFITNHFNVQVIPQVGQLMNATIRVPGIPSFNAKSLLKTTDLSLGGGLGIESPIGLNASVRYFYGFTDTFRPVVNYNESPKNTLQISIGYTFL